MQDADGGFLCIDFVRRFFLFYKSVLILNVTTGSASPRLSVARQQTPQGGFYDEKTWK